MQAKEYVLRTRGRQDDIHYGPKAQQAREDERMRIGAYVELRLRDVPIDVEVLDAEEPGTWVGTIRGWEGHAGRPFEGLRVGDVLRFRDENVFAVRHDIETRPPVQP